MCRFMEAMEAARTDPERLRAECPKCGSTNIETSLLTITPEYLQTCQVCGHGWAQRLNNSKKTTDP